MQDVPVARLGDMLLVTIQVELYDDLVVRLQEEVATQVARLEPRGVIVDISALDVVDSFIASALDQLARMVVVMGSRLVLVGMQPAVAMTLVELGADLRGVTTAGTVERAVRRCREGTE